MHNRRIAVVFSEPSSNRTLQPEAFAAVLDVARRTLVPQANEQLLRGLGVDTVRSR